MSMKKLLIISGHGQGDPGATATIGGKKYVEAKEAVKVANKLKAQLDKYNVIVDVYDTSINAYEFLKAGKTINFKNYDYVLEIHFNACVNDLKGNGKTTGSEILLPTRNTPKSTDLEKHILSNLASMGFKNRGVKTQQLLVINTASMSTSASLLEVCFIDDKDDMDIYVANRTKVAKKIANAFVRCWNLKECATITKKAALRNQKKLGKDYITKWLVPGTKVYVTETLTSWIKVRTEEGAIGFVAKSKTNVK